MRILHLLASPYWSGPAENVALLATEQRALGHDVCVAIDRLRTEASAEESAAPRFRALDLLDEGGLELSVKSPPWRVWADMRRLGSRELDVIHCHFSHDHFVARWSKSKAGIVRSIHAPRSIRWSLPRADAYTLPSGEYLTRLMGHRVAVLPALVDARFQPAADRAALRRELGIEGSPVVGMVSTFQPSRRHDLGIAAFVELRKRLPDARLILVGDGETLAATCEQVRTANLDSATTFAGYQSADFVRWLQALDVVWILGLGNDWSARAGAQAQACDVRVVAPDLGALASYADAVVPLDPAVVAEATIGIEPSDRVAITNEEIARDMIKLYEELPAGCVQHTAAPD